MPKRERIRSESLKSLEKAAVKCSKLDSFLTKKPQNTDLCPEPVSNQRSVETENASLPSVSSSTQNVPVKDLDCNAVNDKDAQSQTEGQSNQNEEVLGSDIEEDSCNFDDHSNEKGTDKAAVDYMGHILRKDEILKTFKWIELTRPNKKGRDYGLCKICSAFPHESLSRSKNGRLPIAFAPGIEFRDFKWFINHHYSESHKYATECKGNKELWEKSDATQHPWLKSINQIHRQTQETLIHMAVSAYNDMRVGTLSGWSWPSRHLSMMHSQSQINRLQSSAHNKSSFSRFVPTNQELYYVNPEAYSEMCQIIGNMETKKLCDLLNSCISFGIQIDGSQDRMSLDVKFILARLFLKNGLKTVFLGIYEPQQAGAKGLLEAITEVLKNIGCPLDDFKSKLTSITTDGEAANTGEHGGLWTILQSEINKPLITVWCSCHRVDLVLSKIEKMVPEVKWWKSNLCSLASHFRGLRARNKRLRQISTSEDDPDDFSDESDSEETNNNQNKTESEVISGILASKYRRFPSYFEVRMAEHTRRLIVSFLGNRNFVSNILKKRLGTKDEKSVSQGFLKMLQDDYFFHFSCIMADILSVFQILQKSLQYEKLILTDLKKIRDTALVKIKNMESLAKPDGAEEEFLKLREFPTMSSDKKFPTYTEERRSVNKYVPFKRSFITVRAELLASARNFLEEQLKDDTIVTELKAFATARNATELLSASKPFYEKYKIVSKGQLYNESCELEAEQVLPLENRFEEFLSNQEKYPSFSKIRGAILCASPHSMVVERAVSIYNKIKTSGRSNLTIDSLCNFMLVSMNGVGTAYFDPLPVVHNFLESKERRNKLPNVQKYEANRKYVQKFFTE